jgi:NagD protein
VINGVLSDMDGVIYRGRALITGAARFVDELRARQLPFLFLTNNSERTAAELARKLHDLGIKEVSEENFITSAMATAAFLAMQKPGATVFPLGGPGLSTELSRAGLTLTDRHPDYVVVGKTPAFDFSMLRQATRLILEGAKFIGTNPDVLDPIEGGWEPASGSILAAVEAASGKKPYVVGKPNALMMMIARKKLGMRSSETAMIGDRMDTDIIGGMEAGMTTCLVLSGVTNRQMLSHFPYRPDHIFEHVGEIALDRL